MTSLKFSLLLFLAVTLQPGFTQKKPVGEQPNDAKSILAGLKKAEPGDIDSSEPMMLDGITIPVYSEKMEKLSPDQFMQLMMAGEYAPEPYIDKKKKVHLFVLRQTTEEERNMIRKLANQGLDGSTADPEIGKEASSFSVTDISGQSYSTEKLKGKVLVLNFWFVECKPCIMEMPELNKLVERYQGQEVVFLSFARNNQDQIMKFLKKTPFNYKIVPSASPVAEQFGVMGYPTHILIDKEGKIRFKALGLGPTTMTDLDEAILKQLNAAGN